MQHRPIFRTTMKLNELNNLTNTYKLRSDKMPVLFIGHGHPMNAIRDNNFTRTLTKLGQGLESPNAILVISAHWETVGTYVSVNPAPRTIYDFGGFDEALFRVKYEPAGHPALARELKDIVTMTDVQEDAGMGLDHGAWTVLKFIRPQADIPVFQMSMDYTKGPEFHYQLGLQLQALRKRGVMIVCSGNVVHNLGRTVWNDANAKPHNWNLEFDQLVKQNLDNRRFKTLVNYDKLGEAARLSIPTNDHYLPLVYSLGLIDEQDPISHIYEGYEYAGISMRSFMAG